MATIGSKDTLVVAQDAIDGRGICLRATHKENNLSLAYTAGAAHHIPRLDTIGVETIAYGMLQVGGEEPLHNIGVGTCGVV